MEERCSFNLPRHCWRESLHCIVVILLLQCFKLSHLQTLSKFPSLCLNNRPFCHLYVGENTVHFSPAQFGVHGWRSVTHYQELMKLYRKVHGVKKNVLFLCVNLSQKTFTSLPSYKSPKVPTCPSTCSDF